MLDSWIQAHLPNLSRNLMCACRMIKLKSYANTWCQWLVSRWVVMVLSMNSDVMNNISSE